MPRISANLDNVDDSRKLLPADWYRARIKSAEIKTSRNPDPKTGQYNQYINWELETGNNNDENHDGMTLYYNTTFTNEGGLKMVKRMLKAIGMDWDADGFDTEEAIGAELEINVAQKEYPVGSGELQNEVKGVRSL
jgi:hypothetical protein